VQRNWVNIIKQQVTGRGRATLRDTLIQPMEVAINQITFLTVASVQALLGNLIGGHTTHQNVEVKSIMNKDHQVASEQMLLGALLIIDAHNIGGRFVE